MKLGKPDSNMSIFSHIMKQLVFIISVDSVLREERLLCVAGEIRDGADMVSQTNKF